MRKLITFYAYYSLTMAIYNRLCITIRNYFLRFKFFWTFTTHHTVISDIMSMYEGLWRIILILFASNFKVMNNWSLLELVWVFSFNILPRLRFWSVHVYSWILFSMMLGVWVCQFWWQNLAIRRVYYRCRFWFNIIFEGILTVVNYLIKTIAILMDILLLYIINFIFARSLDKGNRLFIILILIHFRNHANWRVIVTWIILKILSLILLLSVFIQKLFWARLKGNIMVHIACNCIFLLA